MNSRKKNKKWGNSKRRFKSRCRRLYRRRCFQI